VNELKEFRELNLKPALLDALKGMDFNTMTEVQELSIPVVLQHKDLIVRSKTGSGKTGAFLVPIFQELEPAGYPQALIILPTRELAVQVNSVAEKFARKCNLRTTVVYGGASINMQMSSLRRGVDIVIGTPGRIIDLMDRGALKFNRIKFLVLDEADLMLDMGFIEDVELIISMAPADRQTMLFSATMPREIADIAKKHMKSNAARITVGEEEDLTVSTITHSYFIGGGRVKFAALMAYIEKFEPKKCIIFTSTQRESEYVHNFLTSEGLNAIVMHGGLTQAKREYSLREFKTRARFLISTNLASRGLDIPDITDIINFDAPDDPRVYVHRVGRSARMGKDGRAFTIFSYDQEDLLRATQRAANIKMNHIDLNTEKYKELKLPMQQRRSGGFNRDRGGGGGYRGNREGGGTRRDGGRDRFPHKYNRHEYGRGSGSSHSRNRRDD
jgi:ATP-dependent RNA helicase DeaD